MLSILIFTVTLQGGGYYAHVRGNKDKGHEKLTQVHLWLPGGTQDWYETLVSRTHTLASASHRLTRIVGQLMASCVSLLPRRRHWEVCSLPACYPCPRPVWQGHREELFFPQMVISGSRSYIPRMWLRQFHSCCLSCRGLKVQLKDHLDSALIPEEGHVEGPQLFSL